MVRRLIFGVILAASAVVSKGEFPSKPYPAVVYEHKSITEPVAQQIYVTAVDLTQPGVQVRVSRGGEDPDGDGEWQTTLMRPTKVADREGFDVVVNGDFFAHLSGKDAEGAAALKEFKGSTPAKVVGLAMTDGKLWAKADKALPMLVVNAKGGASIQTGTKPPRWALQAIAGHDVLVRGRTNVAPVSDEPGFVKGPHPRTAVGIKDGGKTLLLVVVDGRAKGKAVGMSLSELADVFVQLKADDAINLDGGGSSVMAIRDPKTKQMTILNSPSDKDEKGVSHERAVADVLGIKVTGLRNGPATRPAR